MHEQVHTPVLYNQRRCQDAAVPRTIPDRSLKDGLHLVVAILNEGAGKEDIALGVFIQRKLAREEFKVFSSWQMSYTSQEPASCTGATIHFIGLRYGPGWGPGTGLLAPPS